jgi:hypothetical protein
MKKLKDKSTDDGVTGSRHKKPRKKSKGFVCVARESYQPPEPFLELGFGCYWNRPIWYD